jgi:hypothetical protein
MPTPMDLQSVTPANQDIWRQGEELILGKSEYKLTGIGREDALCTICDLIIDFIFTLCGL